VIINKKHWRISQKAQPDWAALFMIFAVFPRKSMEATKKQIRKWFQEDLGARFAGSAFL